MRRISAAAATAALFLVLPMSPALASTPRAAAASSGARLPLDGFSDIVADPAHGHEFISGGPGVNGVTVANAAGHVVKTLSGLPGASGMVLSSDGSELYVALADGDGVERIDTATLAKTKFSTGASTCPATVAITAGLVWFGYGCDSGSAGVGSLDPSTSTVHLDVITGFYDAPAIAASPHVAGALFTATRGQSPDDLSRYDVVGGDTPSGTYVTSREVGGNFGDMAFTRNGGDLLVADGGVYHHQVYSTVDLASDGTYATDSYPNSVAVNEDGLIAAGINGIGGRDLWLYHPGATHPQRTWEFGDGAYLAPGGLAYAGTSIYAVTSNFSAPYTLRVVSTLPHAPLTVTTGKKKVYSYGRTVHITAALATKGPQRTVSIYATPVGGKKVLVRKGSAAHGGLSAKYRVTRRTIFTAEYAGGSKYGYTERSTSVAVRAHVTTKLRGAYATQHGTALYRHGKDPKQLVRVTPNHAGECVSFTAQTPHGSRWKTVATSSCVPLGSASTAGAILTGTHVPGERLRLRAEWGGDHVNTAQDGRWQYLRFTR